MGCFYTGFDYKNRKNGYWKIGESGYKTPAQRLATIRQGDCFQCTGYLLLKNDTLSERRALEALVRLAMERAGFKQVQNDHFLNNIEQGRKYEQAAEITGFVMAEAVKACEYLGIQYEVGAKKYKRG